jgi:hypothetical protein
MNIERVYELLEGARINEDLGDAEEQAKLRYEGFFNDLRTNAAIRTQLSLAVKYPTWRDMILALQAGVQETEPLFFGLFKRSLGQMACSIERTDCIL